MGLWQRLVEAFGGGAPKPAKRPRSSPAPSPAEPPELQKAIAAKPNFAGVVARYLEGSIKGLIRETTNGADKQLLALLLRAVKNDGADLPAMPKELIQIQRLLNDTEVEIGKLAAAVQRDPSIAAKFLAVANSPFYASRHRINDVHQAIVRLGLSTTQMLITAILARARVFRVPQHEEEAAQLYEHALRSAALAQLLARVAGQDEQAAFMSGLFHDLGRVFVLTCAGQVESKDKKARPDPELLVRMQDVLDPGFSAMIVESWGYDEEIVQAIFHHHEPVPAAGEDLLTFPEEDEALTYIVAAGDQLAFGFDTAEHTTDAARQLLEALDIELTEELLAMARGAVEAFMFEIGATEAA